MSEEKAVLVNSRIKDFVDNVDFNEVFEMYGEFFDQQSDSVKETIINKISWKLQNLMSFVDGCESPIETMICAELEDAKEMFQGVGVTTNLKKQEKIKCGRSEYRVDFVLEALAPNGNITKLIIECDGHDFHEKTKEQAARDKSRDRELMVEGYYIIRFTGSEIFNDSIGCAWDVMRVMKTLLKKDVEIPYMF